MSITVILPDNKRVNIKATINSLLAEILEKVCTHQGLESGKHTLHRLNRPLDLCLSLRLASVPLNSELNLVFDPNKNVNQLVSVTIQYQDRERKSGQFRPNETLWHVINSLCAQSTPELSDDNLVFLIHFMNKKFEGRQVLQSQTLQSIGIFSGKVLFRMDSHSAQATVTQKYVENIFLKKPEPKPVEAVVPQQEDKHEKDTEKGTEHMEVDEPSKPSVSNPFHGDGHKLNEPIQAQKFTQENSVLKEFAKLKESTKSSKPLDTSKNIATGRNKASVETDVEFEKEIKYLGNSKNELLYSIEDSPKFVEEEQSDDFFQHTSADLKHLLQELKRQQIGDSEAHLEVNKTREEREKAERNKFSQTIVRVVFPYDKLILQAVFKPNDSISTLMNVIRRYIENEDIYLFAAPPKQILPPDAQLVDLKLVPTALIYCGTNASKPDGIQKGIIRDEFKAQLTPFRAASQLAVKQMKTIFRSKRVG